MNALGRFLALFRRRPRPRPTALEIYEGMERRGTDFTITDAGERWDDIEA